MSNNDENVVLTLDVIPDVGSYKTLYEHGKEYRGKPVADRKEIRTRVKTLKSNWRGSKFATVDESETKIARLNKFAAHKPFLNRLLKYGVCTSTKGTKNIITSCNKMVNPYNYQKILAKITNTETSLLHICGWMRYIIDSKILKRSDVIFIINLGLFNILYMIETLMVPEIDLLEMESWKALRSSINRTIKFYRTLRRTMSIPNLLSSLDENEQIDFFAKTFALLKGNLTEQDLDNMTLLGENAINDYIERVEAKIKTLPNTQIVAVVPPAQEDTPGNYIMYARSVGLKYEPQEVVLPADQFLDSLIDNLDNVEDFDIVNYNNSADKTPPRRNSPSPTSLSERSFSRNSDFSETRSSRSSTSTNFSKRPPSNYSNSITSWSGGDSSASAVTQRGKGGSRKKLLTRLVAPRKGGKLEFHSGGININTRRNSSSSSSSSRSGDSGNENQNIQQRQPIYRKNIQFTQMSPRDDSTSESSE